MSLYKEKDFCHLIGVGPAQDTVGPVQIEQLDDRAGLLRRFVRELVIGRELYFTVEFPTRRRDVQFLDEPLVVIERRP